MLKAVKNILLEGRSGMALVLTLLAISFMIAVTVQLFASVNWQMQAAVNLKDSIRLDALTRSGLSLIRAALRADTNEFDSLHDDWNSFDAEQLSSLFGSNQLNITVVDLSGRLQVNALVSNNKNKQEQDKENELQINFWKRFLLSGDFAVEKEEDAEIIIQSIKDWIDKDDDEEEKGAESGFYKSMSPPYVARNGPIVYLEELLLIQGMTNELFYGNEEHAGISDYLTVVGDEGKININSAPEPVLLALHEDMSEEMVQDIIAYRENEDNKDNLNNINWLQQVESVPDDVKPDPGLISVTSNYFKVTSTARVNEISRQGTGIIHRKDKGEQLLKWEVR